MIELLFQIGVARSYMQGIRCIHYILQLCYIWLIGPAIVSEPEPLAFDRCIIKISSREKIGVPLADQGIFTRWCFKNFAFQDRPLHANADLVVVFLMLHPEIGPETMR